MDDDIWEFQRAVASPLFKKHSLDHMRQVFAEKAIDVVNKMQVRIYLFFFRKFFNFIHLIFNQIQ